MTTSPTPSVLARLQLGLEALYRVETRLDVRLFVVNDSERDRALEQTEARRPREQLLVHHDGEDVSVGLYLDAEAIANLERHDPSCGLSDANFHDFCLAVEGVSHFIYVVLCAAADRPVTALELELQAEVDKFVSCLLLDEAAATRRPADLRARLYEQIRYADDLDGDERDRYRTANDQARRYADSLERRFVHGGRIGPMLNELRQFYRLPLGDKLGHIARAAESA